MSGQRFDGLHVDVYEGRFNGGFDLGEEDAAHVGLEGLAIFVVAARVGRAQFETLRSGDVRRRNTFLVSDARMLTGAQRDQAIEYLAHADALTFSPPTPAVPEPAPPLPDQPPPHTNGHHGERAAEVVQVGAIPKRRDEVLRQFLEQP